MTNMVSTRVSITNDGVAALATAIETIDDDKYIETKLFHTKSRHLVAVIISQTT